VSRKRPLSEVENINSAPATSGRKSSLSRQKQPFETRLKLSLKLSERLKISIHVQPRANLKSSPATVSKGAKKQDVSADAAAGFEFEKDKLTGQPYIYLVLEKTFDRRANDFNTEVLSTFATLEDANNCVRIRCTGHAERDDEDALFTEEMSLAGLRISWTYEDEDQYEREVWVERFVINTPGSVPARDWGRPIGAPCPPKEDSDSESSSSYDE
jgi:hypothetical protein